MNPVMKHSNQLLPRTRFTGRLLSSTLTLLSLMALLCGATSARAACGFTGTGLRNPIRLPMLAHAVGDQDNFASPSKPSIVGLWQVVYTAGGATFNQTLDQWHSDGTEFENAWLPPDTGNICFGVWKETRPGVIRLHHVGWTFTPGSVPPTADGTFTLDEVNVVSPDGKTYTGSFTFKTYNIDGSFSGTKVTGTIAAVRITVDGE